MGELLCGSAVDFFALALIQQPQLLAVLRADHFFARLGFQLEPCLLGSPATAFGHIFVIIERLGSPVSTG
jgi:hypothetical protein